MNKYIWLAVALLLGACAKVTLVDQSMNAFTASASQDQKDHIAVEWVTNSFYKSYQVLRSETKDGTYRPVTLQITGDTFLDPAGEFLTAGKSYYYKVRGYNSKGIPFYTSESVEGIAGSSAFGPPRTLQVSRGTSLGGIELSWKRVPGAIAYEIYRSKEKNGPFRRLTKTSYLQYEDREGDEGLPLNPGDVYYYKISSINSDGDPSAQSYPDGDSGIEGYTFGGNAGLTSDAGAHFDHVALSWNPVKGVNQYRIFRSPPGDRFNIGSVIATLDTGTTSYQDREAKKGEVYYYTLFLQGEGEFLQQPSQSVKSYLKSETAPAVPQNFAVSQGSDPKYVRVEWSPVDGATLYEISRSAKPNGPWTEVDAKPATDASGKLFVRDDPYTDAEVQSFSYYYRVAAGNPALSAATAPQQGWANKPPANIQASKIYGARVALTWDSVPRAVSYDITYAESANGVYSSAGVVSPSGGARESFNHRIAISEREKSFFYRIVVRTDGAQSDPSEPVEGRIAKVSAPKNLVVRNNGTSSESLIRMAWDPVDNASGYRIYRATLRHRHAQVSRLRASDYVQIAQVPNNAYQDSLRTYPLRRYDYKIVAVDYDGSDGEAVFTKNVVSTADKSVYRLPTDTMDFMRDLDKTIVEAQTRIPGFGAMGSAGSPKARASGDYIYAAGTTAVNNWRNYTSFEVSMNGETSFSVNVGNLTATQSGTVQISGLYSGSITYHSLVGALGGITTGGSITVNYKGVSRTYNYTDLGSLDNIRLSSESPPPYPSYADGGGGDIQPGWSR